MMYSLHDITTVCPKLEPVDSDEGECNEVRNLNQRQEREVGAFAERFAINNNTIHVKESEYNTTAKGDKSLPVRTTNGLAPYDNVSTTQSSDMFPEQLTVTNTTASHRAVSMDTSTPEIKIGSAFTVVPIYEINGHEEQYYPVSAAESVPDTQKSTQQIYGSNNIDSHKGTFLQQNGAAEGLSSYPSSIYGTGPYDYLASNSGLSPYQGLASYSGTHRALTPYEMGLQAKPCCQCSCHLQVSASSAHLPVYDLQSQRPSVIMVPSKVPGNLDGGIWGSNAKVDSDSSDDDEEGNEEKYFRVNIDGTTARFKLTREDWERIPINTFPSGGRLLSGDWTRIFLEKVKESNPWCSLRFKNNHVRSENSRKIHSAVFFRGGAECKRPECNVKVRFVIQKERGKYVDVSYVGNVCHSSQLGGGSVASDKKRKQVRRTRIPSNLPG